MPGTTVKSAKVKETILRDVGRIVREVEATEKRASPTETRGRLDDLVNLAHQELDARRRKSAAASLEVTRLEEERKAAYRSLSDSLRAIPHEPFARFEAALMHKAGSLPAKGLGDLLWAGLGGLNRGEKRASVPDRGWRDWTAEPYAPALRVLALSDDLREARKTAGAEKRALQADEKRLRDGRPGVDAASDRLATLSMPSYFGNVFPGKAKTDELWNAKEREKAIEQASDPLHERRIKAVRVSSDLNEALAYDSVLKHIDRKTAYQAFNDLNRTFPSMAEHPIIMLGLMRRALEDRADSDDGVALPLHESVQLASLGSSLGDGRAPQRAAV